MKLGVKAGFTMVELVVVITIILALAGLLAPVVQIASRTARRTNTQALLSKVDAGLRRFKLDVGVYPYQAHDTSGATFISIDNRLAYHLTRSMTVADSTLLKSDVEKASSCYDTGVQRFTVASALVAPLDGSYKSPVAMVLNRMGRERARLMITAGDKDVTGVGVNSGIPLISPSGTAKGWGNDYLGGDIPARNIKNDALVDYYGNPLLYVCPVVCGIHGPTVTPSYISGYERYYTIDEVLFGFQAVGRSVATTLSSDIRNSAGSAYVYEFELWSSGPDGRSKPLRSDEANKDNISASLYLKGLIP